MSIREHQPDVPENLRPHFEAERRLSKLPWSWIWNCGNLLCRTRWGRQLIDWRRTEVRDSFVPSSRRLFTVMGLNRDQQQRELTRVYQNTLFQTKLLGRLARLSPTEEARQFEVRGFEHFEAERAGKKPVIFAGSHFGVNRLFPLWLARRGVEVLSLEQQDQLELMGVKKPVTLHAVVLSSSFKAQATILALRQLQSGGICQLTGDKQRTAEDKRCHVRTFHGLAKRDPLGMANLSLMGGAAILPYFCTIQDRGRVTIEIKPPLRPPAPPAPNGSAEREAQILDLTDRFAAVLEAEIDRTPGNQRWLDLEQQTVPASP
jgi:lauroyl/myristoyl acyltransferase